MECIHLCALVCVGFYLQLCVAVKEISIFEEEKLSGRRQERWIPFRGFKWL